MATATLTGTYNAGYTLSSTYDTLDITSTASVTGAGGAYGGGLGGDGVTIPFPATVNNDGAVAGGYGGTGSPGYYGTGGRGGEGGAGVALNSGASLVNTATITGGEGGYGGTGAQGGAGGLGGHGVYAAGPVSVTNYGQISGGLAGLGGLGTYSDGAAGVAGDGVALYGGGDVTNGSATNASAQISGYVGVYASSTAAANVVNFGVVDGDAANGAGVVLLGGGTVTNGAPGHSGAVIYGRYGVYLKGAGTVTNFGTIQGTGDAVDFFSASDRLIAEAGSTFIGQVNGGGGTLELAGGTGTITGLGSTGTLSGAVAMTFGGFGSYVIDLGGVWTLTGANSLAAGQSLTSAGTLANTGAFTNAGTLAGTGTLALTGGTAAFNAGTKLTIARVSQSGTSMVTIGVTNLYYGRLWTQTAGTVSAAAGDALRFTGAGDLFKGTLTGAGTVAFNGGSDVLNGATLSAASLVINGAAVTLANAITLTKTLSVTSPKLTIAAGGASLTGGGVLALTNLATNRIVGATASAPLINISDRIIGAGSLGGGQMKLVNQAGGSIIGNSASNALVIDTGANAVVNAGKIVATGAGGVEIKSAVQNSGVLAAINGDLTLDGAVTGAGKGQINGGSLWARGSFNEAVFFTGATGSFELSHSLAYTAKVSGLSKAGTNELDLLDIAFASGATKATFSGTATGGVLSVTDGTHTAKINLAGNYVGLAFETSSDGHGGTSVNVAPAAAFVQAMATFTPPVASVMTTRVTNLATSAATLLVPHG